MRTTGGSLVNLPNLPQRPGPIKLGGVYPGSGVASGGQQGRIKLVHNGLGAKQGGQTPGASQRRGLPTSPATHQELLAALMNTTMNGRR